MNKLTRISATVASSACLIAGFAGVAGASPASVTGTGNNSSAHVHQTNARTTTVANHTGVSFTNNNPVTTRSGNAVASDNRDASDVMSGAAMGQSTVAADVTVDHSASTAAALAGAGSGADEGAGSATVSDTGNNSDVRVDQRNTETTHVTNDTSVNLVNNQSVTTTSGDARATNNRDAGNVSSGDATGSSSATFSVNVAD